MNRFLVWLSAFVIRAVVLTLRMSLEDRAEILNRSGHPPVIIAFWHNRTGLMAPFFERYCRGRDALTFISRSRDGQFMTDVAARFGVNAIRGSSSRHAVSAMLTALRAARERHMDIVITPDGPRGPRYQVQPGLIRLAQATGHPIIPITFYLKWKVMLKSWDRFQIPIPFSACRLVTAEPIRVPEHATESELAAITARVAEALGGD
jgi:hypothetical protein